MADVAIIDYGMGNLASVRRSVEECGGRASIVDNPDSVSRFDRIILPGVGAFRDGWEHLSRKGWVSEIREAAGRGTPMLGICLGMQLLAERGEEGGDAEGLGLIGGFVMRMAPSPSSLRIPHVGWNGIRITRDHALLRGIEDGTDFYFVHSFKFLPADPEDTLAVTDYGGDFVSVVARGPVFGVQFHPEKSSRPGFRLLKNFLSI
jgi:glutamine amidotransferase